MALDRAVLKKSGWRYYLNDVEVTEAEYHAKYPMEVSEPGKAPGGTPTSGWPMRSIALAVDPSQVDEANARNNRRGCAAHYDRDGIAVIPDKNARRELMKIESEVLGFTIRDRDGFD